MTIAERYQETIALPRAIRFPVELIPPEGFDPQRVETWPKVDGRMEYVDGRLLYTPPAVCIGRWDASTVCPRSTRRTRAG